MEELELDKDELKAEAASLGIQFSANIGAAKLKEKIDAYYESQETSGKELQAAVEAKEKSEEKSAEVNKAVSKKGFNITEAKKKANETRVITIIDNDQRVNNQTDTCKVTCANMYFDLGSVILPLNTPVQVRQGHINVLKEIKIPQHVKDNKTNLSTVRMIPRYTISYEDRN